MTEIWNSNRMMLSLGVVLFAVQAIGIGDQSPVAGGLEQDGQNSETMVMQLPNAGFNRARGLMLFHGKSFSGIIETLGAHGQITGRDTYLAGKRNGSRERWYANGTRESYREYRENRKHGIHKGWFANGQLRFQMRFDDGQYEGERKEWHESGQLAAVFNYKSGKEIGTQKVWDATGKLRSNYVVKNGRRYGLIGAKPCVTLPEIEPTTAVNDLLTSQSKEDKQ